MFSFSDFAEAAICSPPKLSAEVSPGAGALAFREMTSVVGGWGVGGLGGGGPGWGWGWGWGLGQYSYKYLSWGYK